MSAENKTPPFFVDLLYDLFENERCTKENAVKVSSDMIKADFEKIEDAIKDFDLQKALKLIEDAKGYY